MAALCYLGKYDVLLQEYLKTLRVNGGVVSSQMVIPSATGIIKHHDNQFMNQVE